MFHVFLIYTDEIPPAIALLKITTLQIRELSVCHGSEPVTSIYESHNTYSSLSDFWNFFYVTSELYGLNENR